MLISNNFQSKGLTLALVLGSSLAVTGCQAVADSPIEALSVNTTSQAVIEVQSAIAEIQNTPAPRVSGNVFETSPHLLIEKGRVKGKDNLLLDGSYSDLPDQYTLQIRGESCGLYYAKLDVFVPLESIDCIPYTTQ
ncbi:MULTISPECIES: hypothetical protein [unclassified Vibrio]|uniref:hypothetical protein n=1 Tax=unclassified Vibrio TaxID=2614977 RepID=UPI002554076B|nr:MULTISPECIES: hypothetical protein [unclassified Vibrio]MDK9776079.1 hypothetical protein [Vibrio sp. D401a]MDK9804311.1 hypothetical protein [Vibrio sp. D406a]